MLSEPHLRHDTVSGFHRPVRRSARGSALVRVVKRGDSAFTLIEILVALSIFSGMAIFLFTTAGVFARGKKLLDDRRSLELLGEQVLLRLTSEVANAYNGRSLSLLRSPGQPSVQGGGAPVEGGQEGLQEEGALSTVFRAVPGRTGSDDQDTLTFILEQGGQFLPEQQGHQGAVQVTYRLVPDPESRTGMSLVREEVPLISPPEAALKKRMLFPITNQIRSFRCRSFRREKQQWSALWGDNPDRTGTPDLIELQITLVSPGGLATSYTTAVTVSGF